MKNGSRKHDYLSVLLFAHMNIGNANFAAGLTGTAVLGLFFLDSFFSSRLCIRLISDCLWLYGCGWPVLGPGFAIRKLGCHRGTISAHLWTASSAHLRAVSQLRAQRGRSCGNLRHVIHASDMPSPAALWLIHHCCTPNSFARG